MDIRTAVPVLAMLLTLVIPVVVIVWLLRVSLLKLAGRRSGHDRINGALSRAAIHASHLQADTPDVDEIAVPLPPRPPDRRR